MLIPITDVPAAVRYVVDPDEHGAGARGQRQHGSTLVLADLGFPRPEEVLHVGTGVQTLGFPILQLQVCRHHPRIQQHDVRIGLDAGVVGVRLIDILQPRVGHVLHRQRPGGEYPCGHAVAGRRVGGRWDRPDLELGRDNTIAQARPTGEQAALEPLPFLRCLGAEQRPVVRAIPLGLVDEIRPVGGHVVFGLAVLRGDDPLPDQLLPWEAENHVVASPVEQGQHLLNRGVLRGDDLVGLG